MFVQFIIKPTGEILDTQFGGLKDVQARMGKELDVQSIIEVISSQSTLVLPVSGLKTGTRIAAFQVNSGLPVYGIIQGSTAFMGQDAILINLFLEQPETNQGYPYGYQLIDKSNGRFLFNETFEMMLNQGGTPNRKTTFGSKTKTFN